MKPFTKPGALFSSLLLLAHLSYSQTFNIIEYGAGADKSETANAGAIQSAIEAASKAGGTVLVPAGTFKTRGLRLRSNMTLHLEKDGVLLGAGEKSAYSQPAFIYASNISNIKLTGLGAIDGNGGAPGFVGPNNAGGRPKLIVFSNCRNIIMTDITLRNSATWTGSFQRCDSVRIQRVKVNSFVNWNNDGLDIDAKNVYISDCNILAQDDALCLKSENKDFVVENVVAERCTLATQCNFIKFGTASEGGFKNIRISDIVIKSHPFGNTKFFGDQWLGGLSGIALEMVDGGVMDNVTIERIVMKSGVWNPIFIRLSKRDDNDAVGRLRNITIRDVISILPTTRQASNISAYKGAVIENVALENILLNCIGGGTKNERDVTNADPVGYPESRFWNSNLPAYGLWFRNVDGLRLSNIRLNLLKPDARPAIAYDNVKNLKESGIVLTSDPNLINPDTSFVGIVPKGPRPRLNSKDPAYRIVSRQDMPGRIFIARSDDEMNGLSSGTITDAWSVNGRKLTPAGSRGTSFRGKRSPDAHGP
jgi:polygalacturonase